jgi:putative tributyrin esterase
MTASKGGANMAWLHMQYHSETLRMPVPMEVLIPQQLTDGTRGTAQSAPYATLYLLHDLGEDQTAWLRRSSLEALVDGLPLAVVMPAGHRSWYTNMTYGRDYFKFLTEELPELCERNFPLSSNREHRILAGIGMGGYGALKAGLQASDTFGTAASFAGQLDVSSVYEGLEEKLAADIFGLKASLQGSEHDLWTAAEQLAASDKPRPQLYLWCEQDKAAADTHRKFQEHAIQLGLQLSLEQPPTGQRWQDRSLYLERLLTKLPSIHATS